MTPPTRCVGPAMDLENMRAFAARVVAVDRGRRKKGDEA